MADVSHAEYGAGGGEFMTPVNMILVAATVTTPVWRRYFHDAAGLLADLGAVLVFFLTVVKLREHFKSKGSVEKGVSETAEGARKGAAAAEALSKRSGPVATVLLGIGIVAFVASLFSNRGRVEAAPLPAPQQQTRQGLRSSDDAGGDDAPSASGAPEGAPEWMQRLWADIGTREIPGSRHNPKIVAYFRDAGFPTVTNDETAWCAAVANAGFERCGIPGTKSLAARSFERWGTALETPRLGCVVVMWRGSRTGWQGHVGLYVRETRTHVYVLGGNQADALNVQAFPKNRVLSYRWPRGITESRTARATAGSAAAGTGSVVVTQTGQAVESAAPTGKSVEPAAKKIGEAVDQWGYFEPLRQPLETLGSFWRWVALGLAIISVLLVAYATWRRYRDQKERGI